MILNNKNLYGDVYIYKITAVQNPSSALESKTYVNTTEKPIKVTLSNTNSPQEITLAAIRESDSDPWMFFNFSGSDALDSIEGISVSDNTPRENSFNIYRFGTEFAVTNFEGKSGNKLPETLVTNLSASSTASILVKDGKYIEDLNLKGILKGIKLDSIKPTDLMARITYRNNISNEAKIKVNGVNVSQTNNEDKTVPGYSYCHSFVVDFVNDYSLMGNNGEYSFTINLNGVETESFPSSFLIEFYNKVDSEKILPYVLDSAIDITQNGDYGYIGGICGSSTGEISQSYIQNSTINANIVGNTSVGGVVGETKSSLSNCYALNTKVNVTANSYDNIGGIIGKLTDQSKLSSSYFYYDKDNESPVTLTSTSDSNKLGLLVGRDSSSSSIRNCFTNKSGTLIGESTGTVTNCYDDIASYEKFSIQTWADGAWDAYKVGADKPWLLDLKELTRN